MTQGVIITLSELIALKSLAGARRQVVRARQTTNGKHAAKARGRGMDFADVRHYQAGDDIRHMEWRITARSGQPHVKLYEEERERAVMILIDFNRCMYFGTRGAFKSYLAAQLAGLLAWTAIKQGDKVGGLLFSAHNCHDFAPKLRQANLTPYLKALSTYTHLEHAKPVQQQTINLSSAVLRLDQITQSGSLVILISDFYQLNPSVLPQLARLKARHDLIALHVCDPIELTAPPAGIYPISDGRQAALLNLRSSYARRAYQERCEQRIAGISECFRQLNAPCQQVTTETKLASFVQQIFPRRSYA